MELAAEAKIGALLKIQRLPLPFSTPWSKWYTCNRKPLSKLTTLPLAALTTKPYRKNAQNPSRCISTGLNIMCGKANFTYFGVTDQTTRPTTKTSTTLHPIIARCGPPSSNTMLPPSKKILNYIIFKGVLIPLPGARYPKFTQRPVSSTSYYVGRQVPH